jgi:transposase
MLRPEALAPVPAETARVARAVFRQGNVYLRLREELGSLYCDERFAALFPRRGQPALPPWRLALIAVFQFMEGLPDRQAAEAVRSRIDWKYVLGLELTDPGFDASVLSEFRTRLVAGGAEALAFELLLERLAALGLVRARGQQRTDATHVLAAVRQLNRLVCVGETLRQALNALATVAPAWLAEQVAGEAAAWAQRYGARVEEYRLPKSANARTQLAEQIGADGHQLLAAVWAAGAPGQLRRLAAVETLRQVWLQQYHGPAAAGRVRWRSAEELPPAALRISSPYDPEARYGVKRQTAWLGYKTHLTESCDPDRPHLVTDVATTPATTPDGAVLPALHARLAQQGLLPAAQLVDAGYPDAALLVRSRQEHSVTLLGPLPADTSWQARAGQGFAAADFTLDWVARQARCPQGQPSVAWTAGTDRHGQPCVTIRFGRAVCQACPVRAACTRAATAPRQLQVHPQEQHDALVAARELQTTTAFPARYALRAGIEGTLSQAVRRCDLRQARYLGLAKARLQAALAAAALNLWRLRDWWAQRPPITARPSAFARLVAATT